MKSCVELARRSRAPARKIGPADGADEQRVAGQHEPWLGPALQVGHEQADALGRVARRVQHLDARVAELDLVPVAERRERTGDVCRFVQAVPAPVCSRQRSTAGPVIGVHVRVDDMRDAHALAGREGRVRVHIVRDGHRRRRIGQACRSRRDTPRSRGRNSSRVEKSSLSPSVRSLQRSGCNAACHGKTRRPPFRKSVEQPRARRPLARSSSTARSA